MDKAPAMSLTCQGAWEGTKRGMVTPAGPQPKINRKEGGVGRGGDRCSIGSHDGPNHNVLELRGADESTSSTGRGRLLKRSRLSANPITPSNPLKSPSISSLLDPCNSALVLALGFLAAPLALTLVELFSPPLPRTPVPLRRQPKS